MYLTPQPYRCIKCGHEEQWTPHNVQSAPIVWEKPVCPKCWSEFLMANLGVMYCTIDWNDGSEYDKMKNSVAK
jgi:DNA-directed RNA polymerase subunit RPC12/RpoP